MVDSRWTLLEPSHLELLLDTEEVAIFQLFIRLELANHLINSFLRCFAGYYPTQHLLYTSELSKLVMQHIKPLSTK